MKGKIKREPNRASSLLILGDLWPHISVITPQRNAKMRDFHSSQAKWEATSYIPLGLNLTLKTSVFGVPRHKSSFSE